MVSVYGKIAFDPKTHQVIPSYDPKQGAVGPGSNGKTANASYLSEHHAVGKIGFLRC
jgi:hypothetical protein